MLAVGKAFYHDVDPFCSLWTANLIAAGHVAAGDAMCGDVRDVLPSDLDGYTQCHLFAGIGLWSHALRLAGWGDDRPVWTISCPCQPFSQAGRGDGIFDDRHLWPAAHWLIAQQRPVAIIGEQVAGPDGTAWLDIVSSDLEALGYAVRSVVVSSAGVGAPNIRERLYWMADATTSRCAGSEDAGTSRGGSGQGQRRGEPERGGATRGLADADEQRRSEGRPDHAARRDGVFGGGCADGRVGDATSFRWSRQSGDESAFRDHVADRPPHPWRELEWIACLDGRLRPIESSVQRVASGDTAGVVRPRAFPLAPRQPGDVAKLRAYGNAINPYVAAEVIRGWMNDQP